MRLVRQKKKKHPVREFIETILGAAILAALIMIFIARAFTVDGPSMLPTLQHGERLLVDKLSYRFVEPARGEIVVFKYPQDTSQHFIKRIIAVPGDEVAVTSGKVYINGTELEETYISSPPRQGFPLQVVPNDHYFVLGDNRNNSEDSRDRRVGFVSKDLLVGRAIWRYWPVSRWELVRPPKVFAESN